MKGVYKKTSTGFIPVDDAAREFHMKAKPGGNVMMTGKRPRNEKHHRKFFKLCHIIMENTDRYRNVDEVCTMFKIATGHSDVKAMSPNNREKKLADYLEGWGNRINSSHHDYGGATELIEAAKILRSGKDIHIPKSISFESMPQDDFNKFYDACISLTCKYIIPALDEGALKNEIEEFVQ